MNGLNKTEEQALISEFVKNLSTQYDRKYWLSKSKNREFPTELWNEIAKNGYFGMLIPEKYGGTGAKIDDVRVFIEEMGRYGIATLHLISQFMDYALLVKYCNEAQKERYFPQLASGSYCSFAITEPDAGTNTFKITTTATRKGDCYRLNGQKIFITGANESKYMLLITRTIPYEKVKDSDKRQGFSIFFIDSHTPGISMTPQDIATVAPENQYNVYFDDVLVPKEDLIGEENKGFMYIFDALNVERIIISAIALGYGWYVFDKAVEYAKQRTIYEQCIGSYQDIQHQLSRAKVELDLADLANQKAAQLYDNNEEPKLIGTYANMAKLAGSEAAYKACDTAIQVHGGYGITNDYDIITVLPFVRAMRVAPVNNEMVLNYIAQTDLGLPKSYR